MKYGMRERISGAVILLALAVIFIPMLFDEPAPRDESPEPTLTIEQPIDIERQPLDEPQPPSSLGQIQSPKKTASQTSSPAADAQPVNEPEPAADQPREEPQAEPEPETAAVDADPIAELAREADTSKDMPAVAKNGEWAVQVGSFGEPGNAERLEKQLDDKGFTAYRQPRDNNLTTVYVGPFASSEAGEKARTALKERANIQGLLIRTPGGE